MPNITVNPTANRVDATTVEVSGTYESASAGSISATLTLSGSSKGGTPVTAGSGAWTCRVRGSAQDGEATVHAVINQNTPPATDAFDGPVTVA